MIGIPTGEITENGKQKLVIKKINDSYAVEQELKYNPNAVLIPCGKCIGCRLDYSKRWSDRMMLELETQKKGVFLTLTYNNENLPCYDYFTGEFIRGQNSVNCVPTLYKKDMQDFMKRLRKHFKNFRIRFFGSGEYGERFGRPHYHIILFGIGLSDFRFLTVKGLNELGQKYYISDELAEIWTYGYSLLSDVSYNTCNYVARYVLKKITDNTEYKEKDGRIREFSLMSRKPGIGYEYLRDNPDCIDKKKIVISTQDGGKEIPIPNYFYRQLINEGSEKYPNPLYNPEKYVIIKETRKEDALNNMFIELANTDKNLVNYLATKEMNKKSKIESLKRNKTEVM